MKAPAALLYLIVAFSALAAQRPNIVVFLADDHGFLDSQVYGSRDAYTPNMVRLAKAGMTFNYAFVASPSCAPSRASLLTGLMPARHGAEANHAKPRAEIKKLPAYFKELGYEVVAFGKVSHYKHTADYGFDSYAHDTFHDHAAIPAALKWLRERKSQKPLCLFVGSNWPHVPWPEKPGIRHRDDESIPPTLARTPETIHAWRVYQTAVTRMDAELGHIYDAALEAFGSNVLFLHTSDHGAQFPFGKWNCYDAGIRTSLIVTWPGTVKPGDSSDALVSWVDILPTLVDAARGPASKEIDGHSFLPVLRGETNGHRSLIFTTHSADGNMNIYPIRSVRSRDWKYIRNLHPEFQFTTHIDLAPRENRPGDWGHYWQSWTNAADADAKAKVRRYHQRPREELYDLRNDPFEQNNLLAVPKHAPQLHELRKALDDWMKEQDDSGKVFGKPRLLSTRVPEQ